MRWRHLFLSFFLGLFFSVALTAQNLLPDPAAAGGETAWMSQQGECISRADGVVRMSVKAGSPGRPLLQKTELSLIPSLVYRFSVEYRSQDGVGGYFYLERSPDWHGAGKKFQGEPHWQKATFDFSPKDSDFPYYAVLSAEPGTPGTLEYRNPALEIVEESFAQIRQVEGNLLKDPAFLEGLWKPNRKDLVEATGDCSLKVTGNPETRSLAVQNGLRLEAGSPYLFSVFVRGTPGAQAEFYLERGNPNFLALKSVKATENWQEATLEFTAPAQADIPFYAVLSTPKGETGTVEYQAPRLLPKRGELRNGNFQAGLAGWIPQNTTLFDHQGDYGLSAKLEGIGQEASLRQDGIAVKKGKIYVLAYDVRGGSDRKYTDIQGATWSRIAVLDEQGNPIPDFAGWRDCFDRWQHKEATFVAPRDMTVSLVAQLKDPGVAYFDNVVFRETNSALPLLEIVLDAPFSYHDGVVQGQFTPGKDTFTGRLFPALKGKALHLAFQGQELTFPGDGPVAFQLPIPEDLGAYPIAARLEDEEGGTLAETTLEFRVRPAPPRSFTFDKNHVFHIDGKPIFPIHSWGNRGDLPAEESFQRHREMGFNIILCNRQLLDMAADAGLLCMLPIPSSFATITDETAARKNGELLRRELQDTLAHPSTALWFVTDEPAWRGEDVRRSLRAYNRLLAYLDDSRPAFLNEAPRGRIEDNRAYSLACDVYGVDIYPIPAPNTHSGLEDKMMTSVGKYTDICRETVRDQKPIWMTIQGFSWGDWNDAQEKIYPTLQESRFMAYQAIAHGATGLSYWGLNLGSRQDDQFLADLSATIHEVNSLSAILIAPETPGAATADQPQVRICQKSNEAGTLWIVLNESGQECQTTLAAPFPKRLRALQEEQILTPKEDGTLQVTLPPYGLLVLVDADKPLPPPLEIPATRRQSSRVILPKDYEKANWIWFPGENGTTDAQAIVRIPVTLDAPLESALLSVAADDGFSCTVNGKEVMRQKEWTCAWTLDVAKELKVGENEILIHAADMGGAPCGLLFALALSDGRTIVSDDSLLCRRPGDDTWVPAEALGPYGVRPWGQGVFPVPYQKATSEPLPIP